MKVNPSFRATLEGVRSICQEKFSGVDVWIYEVLDDGINKLVMSRKNGEWNR